MKTVNDPFAEEMPVRKIQIVVIESAILNVRGIKNRWNGRFLSTNETKKETTQALNKIKTENYFYND